MSWFTNYLQEGQKCCIIDGISSKNLAVTPCVPEGSFLASFFFLVPIFDLPSVTRNTFTLFADDSEYCNVIKRTTDCVSIQDKMGN